jgi:hypothetical protein
VTSGGLSVTVVPAALSTIWLSGTNSEPTSHTSSMNCGTGTSLSCTAYAFGWDAYGNSLPSEASKTAFTCTSWTFNQTGTAANPAPSVSSGSTSHSTTVSHNSRHIAGNLVCADSGKSASTTLTGKIQQNYSLSCTSTCTSNVLESASCTITNSGSYDANFTLNPSETSTIGTISGDCLTGAGGCSNVTVTPGSGVSTLTIGVTATEGDTSRIDLIDPASVTLSCQ